MSDWIRTDIAATPQREDDFLAVVRQIGRRDHPIKAIENTLFRNAVFRGGNAIEPATGAKAFDMVNVDVDVGDIQRLAFYNQDVFEPEP